MYFGLQLLVPFESELYHTRMWGESIISSSGHHCFYQDEPLDPIFQGDIVVFKGARHSHQIGLLRQVARNYMYPPAKGEVIALVDEILPQKCLDGFFSKNQLAELQDRLIGSFFLTEGDPVCIPIQNLKRRMTCKFAEAPNRFANDIAYNDRASKSKRKRDIDAPTPGTTSQQLPFSVERLPEHGNLIHRSQLRAGTFPFGFKNIPSQTIIQVFQIVTTKLSHAVRGIHSRHKVRGEHEMEVYGRTNIVQKFVTGKYKKVYTIPTMSFVDGFALFGKGTGSYFSMMGVYMCPANFNISMRSSIINQFPLCLGSMGMELPTIAETLADAHQALAGGLEVQIHGERVLICSFELAKIGDMPQQNANAGVRSQKAVVCCRGCEVDYEQRNVHKYDIVLNGRYFQEQESIRTTAVEQKTATAREKILKQMGLTPTKSPWLCAHPIFDPFRMTPQEPAHIVPNGLGSILQELLVTYILKESSHSIYAETIRQMKSPEWSRIQNPIKHYNSMSYNQLGQLAQMNPFALRMMLKDQMLREHASEMMSIIFKNDMEARGWKGLSEVVVFIYSLFARLLNFVFQRYVSYHTNL